MIPSKARSAHIIAVLCRPASISSALAMPVPYDGHRYCENVPSAKRLLVDEFNKISAAEGPNG